MFKNRREILSENSIPFNMENKQLVPLLHVFIVTWNEEKHLQELITWYRERVPGCFITIWDNMSTDKTVDIAYKNDCEVHQFFTNNQMDEKTLIDIRNSCWITSKADYIIVCDADEFVDVNYHILSRNNEEKEWDICKCFGYEMVGNEEDTIDTLTKGVWAAGYCKPILFKRESIESINFAPGSHNANPISAGKDLKWKINFPNLYHTKHRSWSNVIDRAKLLSKRRSEHSKKMGWNFHYGLDESIHRNYRQGLLNNAVKVR